MNYAFVENHPEIDFDPSAFKLPDLIQHSQGPEKVPPAPPNPQLEALAQQARREAERARQTPAPANTQVSQNLKQQVQVNASDARAERLKPWIIQIKKPAADPEILRDRLLDCLTAIQACYTGAQLPNDLTTMSILHPLLKCQAYKWDALMAGKSVTPPEPEAQYLQKLRQLKSGLGLVERAALMQLILTLNAQLPALGSPETSEATAQSAAQSAVQPAVQKPAQAAATQTAPPPAELVADADETPFDPIQASRLSLQLRAKLQRTHSAQEKAALQVELQHIERRQQAFFKARQAQALEKQIQEFKLDQTRFAQPGYSVRSFENWRKLRLTGLQTLARVFSQGTKDAAAISCLESAQAQLARLGLTDAENWIRAEQQRLQPHLPVDLQAWFVSFSDLTQHALKISKHLAHQLRQAEQQRHLQSLNQQKSEFKAQLNKLQALESAYLEASPDSKQRQDLLQAYAELLATLPKAE